MSLRGKFKFGTNHYPVQDFYLVKVAKRADGKYQTEIGAGSFIGSNTALVAPVKIGWGAIIAAGSVITDDVPPGAMAVARARQRNVVGWVERRRAGSKAAEAAAARARVSA